MPIKGDMYPAAPLVESSRLPPLLRGFELWTLLFFAASTCFHLFMYLVLHKHGHLVYPFSLNSHDRFYDFTIFTDKFKLFHTAEFFKVGFPINYPAPVALCFEFFFKFAKPHEVFIFVSFCVLSFVVPAALFGRALARRGISPWRAVLFVSIICLLSWPVDLIVDGANAEVFVWLALLIGMWAYATGRGWLAAAFFGVAASMKLFPFVFLALFFSRRQIGKLLFGVATFVGVSVVSLKILGPTVAIAYRGIAFGLDSFKHNYMARFLIGENGVDHSIFCFIKFSLHLFARHTVQDFSRLLSVYLFVTSVGGILLYFLVIRKLPLLNQVLILSIASIYFTAFSGDGTLIHLYYPLAMLMLLAIQAYRDGVTIPGLSTIMYCMVFCLSMESFLVIGHAEQGLRFIGPAHAVGLGIMLVAALRYPLGPPLAERHDETVLSKPETMWAKVEPAA